MIVSDFKLANETKGGDNWTYFYIIVYAYKSQFVHSTMPVVNVSWLLNVQGTFHK